MKLIDEAERDLVDIHRYIATQDSVAAADQLIDEIEKLCTALSAMPQRGHIPPELDRIAVSNYREVHFGPYRVIYEPIGRDVYVHCVIDGRRNLPALLERRMLR